jgi:hypothetical protein
MDTNYAYESGALSGHLKSIGYELYWRGFIKARDIEAVEQLCQEKIDKAKQDAIEYSKGNILS